MVALIVLVLFLSFAILTYILNGWALSLLWYWFVVPFGIPEIGISWAIGLGILFSLLTNHNEPKKNDETDNGKLSAFAVVRPLLAVAVGYIVHSFMVK
jgi:hypothetical protein